MKKQNKQSKQNETAAPVDNQAPPSGDMLPAVAQPKPSGAMLDIFAASAEVKLKRLTAPPIIKPSDLTSRPGVAISGEIVGVKPSPVTTYKSELLMFRHASGKEFAFPATAIVVRALADHFGVEQSKFDLKRAIGLKLAIAGIAKTKTADGQRSLNLLDVALIED
jgi:hypothetical protein